MKTEQGQRKTNNHPLESMGIGGVFPLRFSSEFIANLAHTRRCQNWEKLRAAMYHFCLVSSSSVFSEVDTCSWNRMQSTWSRWKFCYCRHTGGFIPLAPHTTDRSICVGISGLQLFLQTIWINGNQDLCIAKSALSTGKRSLALGLQVQTQGRIMHLEILIQQWLFGLVLWASVSLNVSLK